MPLPDPHQRRRMTLAAVINHPTTDVLVMVIIGLSVVLLLIEEVMELPPDSLVPVLSDVVTWLFAVELSLRYLAAKKKVRFFTRYWADILAVLPLLRPLRLFRFFRLLRLFRLFQLGLLLDRRVSFLRGLFRVNFYHLWVMVVLTVIVVVGSGALVFAVEQQSPRFHSFAATLWWSLYTIIAGEPVGGMPASPMGRVLLAGMMLAGMSLFAIFTGMVSATMIDRLQGDARAGELDIDELEDHIVICGWNEGVKPLLSELCVDEELRNTPVLLVNELEKLPDLTSTGVRLDLLYFMRGDFTQLAVLQRAGIERATRAVVMSDDTRDHTPSDQDARGVLAALTIERLNPNIYCVVELLNSSNEAHLAVAGVEAVIIESDLSGRALAAACRHPNLMSVMMNLLTLRRGETIHRLKGPRTAIRFGDLMTQLKAETDALLIGVEVEGKTRINPPHDLQVSPADYLIVIGGPAEHAPRT